MTKKYSTISTGGEGLFKERGSKFFAYAYPVSSEEEVKEILEKLRKEYHDARHHCYAWKIGVDPGISRANDDGEPSSSAGKPILNQIEKLQLTNVLVVVIRYFGGTLLGVGGLINAYRTAAEDCLTNCKIIIKHIQRIYLLKFDYSLMNDVMKIIKEFDLESYDHNFELTCRLKVRVDLEKDKKVIVKFQKLRDCSIEKLESD